MGKMIYSCKFFILLNIYPASGGTTNNEYRIGKFATKAFRIMAKVAGIALFFLLAGRIIGEEKMLVNDLEGYASYQKKVRYRLIPYVW